MRLINETGLSAAFNVGFRPDGREAVVIVAKATYVLCDLLDAESPHRAENEAALVESDVFGKDPAKNALILETDFAVMKPECDVLFLGSAHAPRGRPAARVPVSLRVGAVSKSFIVTGDRRWRPGLLRKVVPSEPAPFVSQAISYDVAFGGTDVHPRDPKKIATFVENPVGRGFRPFVPDLSGQPMPVTEEAGTPILNSRGPYRPMAFGPLGRSWQPRASYAGTYDQAWMDSRAPVLPLDFDARYFQAAPPDQRMPYPKGGEPIELVNLVPAACARNAVVKNRLPDLRLEAAIFLTRGGLERVSANLDTVVLEPEANRFTCTWRATHSLERDAFDVREIVLGVRGPSFSARARARASGKEYFAGLGALCSREGKRRS